MVSPSFIAIPNNGRFSILSIRTQAMQVPDSTTPSRHSPMLALLDPYIHFPRDDLYLKPSYIPIGPRLASRGVKCA